MKPIILPVSKYRRFLNNFQKSETQLKYVYFKYIIGWLDNRKIPTVNSL